MPAKSKISAKKLAKSPACQVELLASDYTELERLLDDAATVNRDEFEAAKLVGQLRSQLASAEFRLSSVRHQAHEIHTKIAPLWHRLPA